MSRRSTLLELAAETQRLGVTREQLAPFLAAIPADQVQLKRGQRIYSPTQLLEAIRACAAAKKP